MPRIVMDPLVWRTVCAAAALDGISPGRWLERLARGELATSLPQGPMEEPSDYDDELEVLSDAAQG